MLGGWQGHLNEASTQDEVVTLCNQFLSVWSGDDLGQLPAACQPKGVIDLEDVSPYALVLMAHLDFEDHAGSPMLSRMADFFVKAALRLGEIADSRVQAPAGAQNPRSRA
jgi:hypothetical protein